MDRTLLLNHLQLARRHVAESEALVVRQRELVEQLERDGRESDLARGLLLEFEHSLELHRDDLQRLQTELGMSAVGEGGAVSPLDLGEYSHR